MAIVESLLFKCSCKPLHEIERKLQRFHWLDYFGEHTWENCFSHKKMLNVDFNCRIILLNFVCWHANKISKIGTNFTAWNFQIMTPKYCVVPKYWNFYKVSQYSCKSSCTEKNEFSSRKTFFLFQYFAMMWVELCSKPKIGCSIAKR